jgi:hypothetical protein
MEREAAGSKGDQESAVKEKKYEDVRTRRDRLQTRLRRLRAISEPTGPAGDQVSPALTALRRLNDEGGRGLTHISVRPSFITRRAEPQGEMSDRRPPEGPRPPVLELASPNGIAQQVELVALFVAQAAGRHHRDGRVTLGIDLDTTDAQSVDWVDLVVPHSDITETAVIAASRRDARLGQVKRALNSLAAKGLVELPHQRDARGKHKDFRLLDEGGPRLTGPTVPYRLPTPGTETVIGLPLDFYLQGWVYVLTKSEIALWLMLRHLQVLGGTPGAELTIFGAERLRRYGLSKDAYKAWWLLERAGLIEVQVDPSRRPDSTVIDFDPANPPATHRFRLRDEGLGQPAPAAVKQSLVAALNGEPVGVARVNTVYADNLGLL